MRYNFILPVSMVALGIASVQLPLPMGPAAVAKAGTPPTSIHSRKIVLSPFKDDLFRHRDTIRTSHNGLLNIYNFNEKEDVDLRDKVPVKKADPKYVQAIDPKMQRKLQIQVATRLGSRQLEVMEVGARSGANFAVVFIHGAVPQEMRLTLGVLDETFSGNFNRLKNMVIQDAGSYYTPWVRDFGPSGAEEVFALIKHIEKMSPDARIVLACASSGGQICTQIANAPDALGSVAGLFIMGTGTNPHIFNSVAVRSRIPILYTHGMRDSLVKAEGQIAEFDAILQRDRKYPIAFIGFHTGGHGVPIRMIDWREALNWIYSQTR
jgi:hypothetical protein